jgi:hypothetical protein
MSEKEKPKKNTDPKQSHQNNYIKKKKTFRMGGKRGGNNLFFNFKMDLPY